MIKKAPGPEGHRRTNWHQVFIYATSTSLLCQAVQFGFVVQFGFNCHFIPIYINILSDGRDNNQSRAFNALPSINANKHAGHSVFVTNSANALRESNCLDRISVI